MATTTTAGALGLSPVVTKSTRQLPEESPMSEVTLYSTGACPYCSAAESLLKQRGITNINKIRVDQSRTEFETMLERTGRKTVPQIFIDDQHIGGFDDLVKWDHSGKLKPE